MTIVQMRVMAGGILLLLGMLFSACNSNPSLYRSTDEFEDLVEATVTPTLLPSSTATFTTIPSATTTPTPTPTETPTATPLPSFTPTETLTPTPSVPSLVVAQQAHCRYGPGKAYLHAHDLYPGDRANIDGKSASGGWLWIKPSDIHYHCWVAKSVVETQGDLSTIPFISTQLPMSSAGLYEPPDKIWVDRDEDEVTIYWSDVWMTEDDDRGYLVEAFVCQKGDLVFWAVWTDDNHYTLPDDRKGCTQPSNGKLYAVEKHGYLQPLEIPWP